jgi:hypothetical protein
VEGLDRRRGIEQERFEHRQQHGSAFGSRRSTFRAATGVVIRIRAATARKRGIGVPFMQSRRVLEQRQRAVERTALVNRAHRRGEDSILSTMPITMPSRPVPWQADLIGSNVRRRLRPSLVDGAGCDTGRRGGTRDSAIEQRTRTARLSMGKVGGGSRPSTYQAGDYTVVVDVPLTFEAGEPLGRISYDHAGRVAGLHFLPGGRMR